MAQTVRFANSASTTLNGAITNVATSIIVTSSTPFPAITGGQYFWATLKDTSNNLEIIKVTAVSGTTWTVVRSQDGTTAPGGGFASGSVVEIRPTAQSMNDIHDQAVSDAVASLSGTAPVSYSGGVISMAAATASVNGYMTSTYAGKLDGIAAGATNVTSGTVSGWGYITGITYSMIFTAINGQSNTDWYRTSGTTGWYNSTYAVGVYSAGASWVQTYNSANFQVNGAMYATGNVVAYYSDIRLKRVKRKIENALDTVCGWDAFIYENNELANSLGFTDTKEQAGLAAQQLPSQVVTRAPFDVARDEAGNETSKSGEEYLTAQYERLAPWFVAAFREMRDEVKSLREELVALRAR